MVAVNGQTFMATYEVTYSINATSNEALSYSDIVLVEAETYEELTAKVVALIRRLDPQGNYYLDSIGGNPYEPRSKKRVGRKITKDLDNLVITINALISKPNQGP